MVDFISGITVQFVITLYIKYGISSDKKETAQKV